MHLIIAMLALVWTPIAQAVQCESKTTVDDLNMQLAAAESAFAAMDADAFVTIRDDAVTAFECLNQALTSDGAARIHRLVALDAFTRRDDATARATLRSVRILQPGYDLPTTHCAPCLKRPASWVAEQWRRSPPH